MSFGRDLTNARINKSITRKQLADILQVPEKTVAAWENDRNLPELAMVERLEKGLQVTLLSEEDKKRLSGEVIPEVKPERTPAQKRKLIENMAAVILGLIIGIVILIGMYRSPDAFRNLGNYLPFGQEETAAEPAAADASTLSIPAGD